MSYTNYKTGKPCSRAEYIQNGLERGELLYKYDCGCMIIQDRTADAYIVYCPKHEAAPELYEALKGLMKGQEIEEGIVKVRTCPSRQDALRGQQVLAKVEEGKVK